MIKIERQTKAGQSSNTHAQTIYVSSVSLQCSQIMEMQ
jgi:hypothetical protein